MDSHIEYTVEHGLWVLLDPMKHTLFAAVGLLEGVVTLDAVAATLVHVELCKRK